MFSQYKILLKLTILGTGSATPILTRNPSAQVLVTDFESFLIEDSF